MNGSKERIVLEYELKAGSPGVVWQLISEPEGLSRWMADEVERTDNKLLFKWGTSFHSKDERSATILEEKKNKLIRFRWDGDDDPSAYCEMKIERGEITNDCVLVVTDFAEKDDVDSLRDLWEDNMDLLHRASGL